MQIMLQYGDEILELKQRIDRLERARPPPPP
jgi:hypothetical protein